MRLKLLLTASGAALLAAGPLCAQDGQFGRDRNVSVRERSVPGYEVRGWRAGAFLLYPRLEAGLVWSDNALALSENEVSDTVLTLAAAVRAQSQWSRHYLEVFVDTAAAEYNDLENESHSEWGFGAVGRLDVARGATLSGAAEARSLSQPRSDASTPSDALEPVEYDVADLNAAASREVGRVRVGGDVAWTRYEYDAVNTAHGVVAQDYRDEDVLVGGVRVDYATNPGVSVYAVLRANQHDFKTPVLTDASTLNDVDRDSSGWNAGLGVDFDLTHAARGHALFGYLQQDYEDPATPNTDGLSANVWIEWFPSQLTTVTLSADNYVNGSGVGTAAGMLTTQLGLRADHELRRNVLLWAAGAWARDEFEGVDREDKRTDYGAGADFKFNRLVTVRLSFQRYERSSSGDEGGAGYDYTEDRFAAALVMHP